jgi:hypothetical protein
VSRVGPDLGECRDLKQLKRFIEWFGQPGGKFTAAPLHLPLTDT